jgi:hypothetical protein
MTSPSWPSHRTVYVKFYQKWDADYRFDVLGKIMFFPGPANDWYLAWYANGQQSKTATIGINAVSPAGFDEAMQPNLKDMPVTVGRWYEFQWQTTLSSSPTACDGSADIWIDGVHTLSRTGLCKVYWSGQIQNIMVSGYYNGTSPMPSIYWIDDITVSDSFIP